MKWNLRDVDATGTTLFKRRARRVIGVTEQRLRARNQQWWMMTRKGWSEFFGRFDWLSRSKDAVR
jgi:hypothetical protein